jgi:hypothetical protein
MVERNHKAGQNPPRVVASPEEEEEGKMSMHTFTAGGGEEVFLPLGTSTVLSIYHINYTKVTN